MFILHNIQHVYIIFIHIYIHYTSNMFDQHPLMSHIWNTEQINLFIFVYRFVRLFVCLCSSLIFFLAHSKLFFFYLFVEIGHGMYVYVCMMMIWCKILIVLLLDCLWEKYFQCYMIGRKLFFQFVYTKSFPVNYRSLNIELSQLTLSNGIL